MEHNTGNGFLQLPPPPGDEDRHWPVVVAAYHLPPKKDIVMRGIFHGQKYQTIANTLGRTIHDVESHWRAIKRDYLPREGEPEVESHIQAIHLIYEQVLIPLRIKEAVDAAMGGLTKAVEEATMPLLERIREMEERGI